MLCGEKKKHPILGPFYDEGSAAQTLFFTMNSDDFHTQQKCTCCLHFSSIWEAHVPKTLFFTTNVNDFRGVVLEAQKWAKQMPCKSRWPQVQQSWCQIVQIIAHLFAHMLKRFVYLKPPRN